MSCKYKIKFFVIIFGYIVSLDSIIFTSQKSERQMIYEEEAEHLLAKNTDKSKKVQTAAILYSDSKSALKDQQETGNRTDIYQQIEEELLKK